MCDWLRPKIAFVEIDFCEQRVLPPMGAFLESIDLHWRTQTLSPSCFLEVVFCATVLYHLFSSRPDDYFAIQTTPTTGGLDGGIDPNY